MSTLWYPHHMSNFVNIVDPFSPCDELRDEREGVTITDCPLIDSSIVLDRAQLAIFSF